jgi:hypothetical protein
VHRVVLIEYTAADERKSAGTGFIVTSNAVLTADHVASGTGHKLTCGGMDLPVKEIVSSGSLDVDLAVLILQQDVPGLGPMSCARLDRSNPYHVDGCLTVGYPDWRKDKLGRKTTQVMGSIRTQDGLHAKVKPDGEFLMLKADRLPPDAPEFPDEDSWLKPENSWGGMSGAAVTIRDRVIGVVRSWSRRDGTGWLTVTPMTALNLLPPEKYEEFRTALRLTGEELALVPGDGVAAWMPGWGRAGGGAAPGAGPHLAFPDPVRERFSGSLRTAGLAVPEVWDYPALDQLRRECEQLAARPEPVPDAIRQADDIVRSLCGAALALPVVNGIKPKYAGLDKLRHLYERHVGGWPPEDARTLEEMLVYAASAGISEGRPDPAKPGILHTPLAPLARFMLGIAGLYRASDTATLDDPELAGLADWLTGTVGLQREDAATYLAAKVRTRSWALIELAPETGNRDWPRRIVVDVVHENGNWDSANFDCDPPSEATLVAALRRAVAWLPAGDVLVDLCLPRPWLDAGVVEHLPVVDFGEWLEPESLSESGNYEPRLRWALPRNLPKLMDRMMDRFERTDWQADPADIPADVIADRTRLRDWLKELEYARHDGQPYPPFFTGNASRVQGHDPLGELLKQGYGFAVWFGADTDATTVLKADAARADLRDALAATAGQPAYSRRDHIPRLLSRKLRRLQPTIIWTDPSGREGFRMPQRQQATQRSPVATGRQRKGIS